MPLIIPQTLPAYKALEEENVFVMHRARAMKQDIRPLRILLVNLMPTKIADVYKRQALMCSVSTPETSKLRLNEPNLRSRRR